MSVTTFTKSRKSLLKYALEIQLSFSLTFFLLEKVIAHYTLKMLESRKETRPASDMMEEQNVILTETFKFSTPGEMLNRISSGVLGLI